MTTSNRAVRAGGISLTRPRKPFLSRFMQWEWFLVVLWEINNHHFGKHFFLIVVHVGSCHEVIPLAL